MSDDQAKITVTCSREFKRQIKSAISDNGIDQFQEGYMKILHLGLQEMKKGKRAKSND